MKGVNNNREADFGRPSQRSFDFDVQIDPVTAVKTGLAEALKRSSKSRAEIVDAVCALSDELGLGDKRPLTVALLDKMAAPGARNYYPSIKTLHLVCLALKDNLPLISYVRSFSGVRIVDENDQAILTWAKQEIALRSARKRAKLLAQAAGVE